MVSIFVFVDVVVIAVSGVVDRGIVMFVCTPPPDIQSLDLYAMKRNSSTMEMECDDADIDSIASASCCSSLSSPPHAFVIVCESISRSGVVIGQKGPSLSCSSAWYDCVAVIIGGSASIRVCSALSPMKPKHSGKNSIIAPFRFAQPAHLATLIRLSILSLVDRSWAMAARRAAALQEVEEEVVVVMAATADTDTDTDDGDNAIAVLSNIETTTISR